jgi:hypothetical protein
MRISLTNVFLLKLASQMTFNKSGLSSTTVTNKNKLEGRGLAGGHLLHGGNLGSTKSKLLLE